MFFSCSNLQKNETCIGKKQFQKVSAKTSDWIRMLPKPAARTQNNMFVHVWPNCLVELKFK